MIRSGSRIPYKIPTARKDGLEGIRGKLICVD